MKVTYTVVGTNEQVTVEEVSSIQHLDIGCVVSVYPRPGERTVHLLRVGEVTDIRIII